MKEGRELLLSVLNDKLKSISQINDKSYIVENINLIDLVNSINEDVENIISVPDSLIDTIVLNSNIKRKSEVLKDIHNIKNMIFGKNEYNIKFKMNDQFTNTIKIFNEEIINLLNKTNKDLLNMTTILDRCEEIKYAIKKDYLITDLDFIETIVEEYDVIKSDENLLTIFSYIFHHNCNIISSPKLDSLNIDIKYAVNNNLSEEIKEVISNMGIEVNNIPNFLMADLKNADFNDIKDIYYLIKKNKAEDYGILHLIEKENIISKIALLIYSDVETIKNVIDITKDSKGKININLLKALLNNVMTVFISKENSYFHSKYNCFIKNIELLKGLNINYPTLITRTPLFIISDHDELTETLNYFKTIGFDLKTLINRCYKVLSINPKLLRDNLEYLISLGLDTRNFIKSSNYNLLKVTDLERKLKKVRESVNEFDINDFITITKLITENIVRMANEV